MLNRLRRRIEAHFLERRLRKLGIEERFKEIYRIGWWNENRESASGSGSTLQNTRLIREALPGFLRRHGITSMLDAPCGDFNWMQTVSFPDGFSYIGGDIVQSVVDANRAAHPGHSFCQIDLTTGPLPEVDLLFCRDCLFHLSYEDIFRALDVFVRSGIPMLLTTTMPQVPENRDIETGRHRLLNLSAPPFNLPDPRESLTDFEPPRVPKVMGLWTREDVRNALDA